MAPARRVARLLYVHAEIDDVGQHLYMALRLHVTAQQAKGHEWLAILHYETRNNGVERPLARRVHISRFGVERVQFTAVLEHEAEVIGDKSRPHAAIVRLDERDHHAVLVRSREID